MARWIALTILTAMLTALGFNALFVKLAGVWAYPSLIETGLLERIASISRVLEASDPGQRARLAAVVSDPNMQVNWYLRRRDIAQPKIVEEVRGRGSEAIRRALDAPHRRIEAYRAVILAAIDAKVDITLVELADLLRQQHGASFAPSTVWRFLDRHDITVKKNRARQRAATARRRQAARGLVRDAA